jgi:hypothetical protein
MTVVAGTFHVHPDHPDAPAALEVKPLAPLREHFPTLAQRYPERATFVGTFYRYGVPMRRLIFGCATYAEAMADGRMLIGHPPSDDPRAYDRESTR